MVLPLIKLMTYSGKKRSFYHIDFLTAGSTHSGMFLCGIFSIGISVVCFLLAKDRRRNIVFAAVTGFIPGLNYLAIGYQVGVSKLKKV